jgi:superfamily II DNA or RNA helicase
MDTPKRASDFYREYDLADARRRRIAYSPAPHQAEALQKLDQWYNSAPLEPRGGILVLPTGGGKTFTAHHFICRNPLSDGFKVLWLAHTHHLLEQAFFSFGKLVGLIAEPKSQLNSRVVSGTIGHFPVSSIQSSDDVVVSSLQTVCNALRNRHQQLDRFLDSAQGRLFVVFDEAHHSPAPSYRSLMQSLRERCPQMHLMGLTATPTYTQIRHRGWLQRLFPQGIIYQVPPQELMAAGILARPVLEEAQTSFEAHFDEREYDTWVGTNRDLPDTIISSLANSRARNEYIAGCYVKERTRYGKTIIFADRWQQCEQLREALKKRGIRADAIYSHVDANPGSAEARNRRTSTENARVLQAFRDGRLDVLINIRMATEGTDVPDVQTVFLTRQTTSQILLTQMVGRALRGPRFGGTEKAYIVSFIDNWKHCINWAAYDQLAPGLADETIPEYGKRPPLQLISIDLVRRLARQMDSGINVNPAPYKAFLPTGWYRVEYFAQVEGTDDIEPVGQLVMVFEDEKPAFERYIKALKNEDLSSFEEDTVRLADVRQRVDQWHDSFFSDIDARVGGGLVEGLFSVARHLAQNEMQVPKFFPFDVRDDHDLDAVAHDHVSQGLDARATDAALRGEYTRSDRYWQVIYYAYRLFKSHYDACINRILDASEHGIDAENHRPRFATPQAVPVVEPPDELKERVKSRDRFRCLCCGYDKQRRRLCIDHISPRYHGGNHHFDNLQTLCNVCNGPSPDGKEIEHISFRNNQTTLTTPPPRLPMTKTPTGNHAREPEWCEMFLRRTINLFFRCAAVDTVEIGGRGARFRHWRIRLFPGNNEKWLEPHLPELIERIRQARNKAGYEAAPDRITVTS